MPGAWGVEMVACACSFSAGEECCAVVVMVEVVVVACLPRGPIMDI